MTMLYTSKSKRVLLPRGTANYLYRYPEAITILVDIYNGPKAQKDIVTATHIPGCTVKSILAQLFRRGMLIKVRKIPTAKAYSYDLTFCAKLWMLQHYAELLPSTTLQTPVQKVVI